MKYSTTLKTLPCITHMPRENFTTQPCILELIFFSQIEFYYGTCLTPGFKLSGFVHLSSRENKYSLQYKPYNGGRTCL